MRKKINPANLFLLIATGMSIPYLIFFITPNTLYIALFLCCLFLFIYSAIMLFFAKKTHAILAGSFVTIYLLLRINGFTSLFYLVLLAALFLMLELFFSKR